MGFASLPPSLFENLELQLCAELSSVHGVVLKHCISQDESNVLSSIMCQSVSHCTGVILYLGTTDYCLRFGIYDPNKNFRHILPSKQVISLPRLFWPTEEKSITINRATNGN